MGIKNFIEDSLDYLIVDHPLSGVAILTAVLAGVCAAPVYMIHKAEDYRIDLNNRMEIKADSNGDDVVSREEMAKVYNSLGLKLNEVSPRALSNSDIEKYLQGYKAEKEERK